MKTSKQKWLRPAFVGAGILLLVGTWYFLECPHEPTYQGKPASYWFEEYCQASPHVVGVQSEAEGALLSLGTNDVPYLVEVALSTGEDSTLRKDYYKLLSNLLKSWNGPRFVSSGERRADAQYLLSEIKPPAAILLPLLHKALSESNTPAHGQALRVLTSAGEGAETLVPYFAQALHDSDSTVQLDALGFLQRLGPGAVPAVADLMALMNRTVPTNVVHLDAAWTFGTIGSNALAAVPMLKSEFNRQTNQFYRVGFATILCRIDAGQTDALSYLEDSLNNENPPWSARVAASRLGLIGQNARPAIPSLLSALSTTNVRTWTAVLDSLKELGAQTNLFLRQLREKLYAKNQEFQVRAATNILEISPADEEAKSVLVDQITHHTKNEWLAIDQLSKTGTNALDVVPEILEALDGTNTWTWREVPYAMKKIGAPRGLVLPKLKEKLKMPNSMLRVRLAEGIFYFAPDDPDVLAVLTDLIKSHSRFEVLAINILAGGGRAAKQAIPVLHGALDSEKPKVREAAARALKKIRGK